MKRCASALRAFVVIALVGTPLAVAGALIPAAARGSAVPAPSAAVVHHSVKSAGRYDIRVTIRTHSSVGARLRRHYVRVEIGALTRRITTGKRGRATVTEFLRVKRGTLTIRVIAKHGKSSLTVKLSRVQPPSTKAIGPTGPTGPTGPSAPAAPAAPAAPTVDSGITIPAGFAPAANYTTQVKDYEFNGSALPTDWTAGANNTYGYSSTIYQPSQVSMTGSSVALTASNTPSDGYPYQSGWISTIGNYDPTYGMIDFRAQMPAGQGLWSGLWLVNPNGSNPTAEIDVQEMLLGNTHTVYGSLHSWAPSPYWAEIQSTNMAADATTGFHDYQIIWQPGMLTWAVDGVAFAQYTKSQALAAGQAWPYDDATGVHLIANLAVAGSSEWGGAPNAQTAFPATMQVQSVKVWQ
jgi:beta-glucanase (GH16 family)